MRLAAPAVGLAVALANVTGCAATSTTRTDGPRPGAGEVALAGGRLPILQADPAQPRQRVLFIRGARGTAGTNPNGTDDRELADITDLSTAVDSHGYGTFARALADEGYDVAQLQETGTRDAKAKVDLKAAGLSQYAAVIFGSNNAPYTMQDGTEVKKYVEGGGGVLFLSDLNFGTSYGDSPSSDNHFLNQFGIAMNQDNFTSEAHTSADFLDKAHPVLAGVTGIQANGASACTITTTASAGAKVLVPFTTSVQENTIDGNAGQRRPAALTDGALVVFGTGQGRGACLLDRDLFFNSQVGNDTNEKLGLNLVNWLAKRT